MKKKEMGYVLWRKSKEGEASSDSYVETKWNLFIDQMNCN